MLPEADPLPHVICSRAARLGSGVDGGVNPRKSGAGRKVGTKIAVEQFEANGLGGGPLSMPSAAVRRWPKASIYGVCHPVTIDDRDWWLLDQFSFSTAVCGLTERIARRICAVFHRRQQAEMGRISMATRDELVGALAARYAASNRKERGRILDEFVAVSGLHRKHAMRLLRAGQADQRSGPRPARRLYNEAVREALIVLWEASDRVCGKRLRALVPILVEAMERHGHLQLAPEVRAGLQTMSAATIDRALRRGAGSREQEASAVTRRLRRRSGAACRCAPSTAGTIRRRGSSKRIWWHTAGPQRRAASCRRLTLTDIATGWTECAPLLVREQKLLTEVLSEMRQRMPFPLLGFDTDNDSVFMNETVKSYCAEAGLVFTRCRPYRKNDQAWVEQKNGAVVRRAVGYRRYEGLEAAAALATAVFGVAAVRELLPAVVQAGRKSSRWREGQQNISSAGHALSAIAGRCAHQRGRPPPRNGDVCHAGSGSIAENDP